MGLKFRRHDLFVRLHVWVPLGGRPYNGRSVRCIASPVAFEMPGASPLRSETVEHKTCRSDVSRGVERNLLRSAGKRDESGSSLSTNQGTPFSPECGYSIARRASECWPDRLARASCYFSRAELGKIAATPFMAEHDAK